MALVYKVHIQGGSDNTAPPLLNHPYNSYVAASYMQLAEISTATTYGGMDMWKGCCDH